jgi:hypothetical protein
MPTLEVNPALILRNADEAQTGQRKAEECIPDELQIGKSYPFLKKGQRIYWFDSEIPLIEKSTAGDLSRPLASVQIVEVTHVKDNGVLMTRGLYKVIEVFQDDSIHFEGLQKIQQGGGGGWMSKIKNSIG